MGMGMSEDGGGDGSTTAGMAKQRLTRSEINLSSCDELEEREDMESDEDQRKLLEEQESLEAQIRELENTGEFSTYSRDRDWEENVGIFMYTSGRL